MSTISKLNGYDIKDSQARIDILNLNTLSNKKVYFHENVASMIADESIEEGTTIQTKGFYGAGDGGDSLYHIREITNDDTTNDMDLILLDNGLVAELTSDKCNVMCYGVTVDDFYSNNHIIIEYVINKMKYAYCNNSITIKNTLSISGNNKSFKFTNINYTGNNVGILVEGFNIKLDGVLLASSNDGLRIGSTLLTSSIVVNINRIYALNNSVIMGGTDGVLDSQLYINRVEYHNHGIYFDLTNNYVGQIGIYNTLFADATDNSITENYAIYMDCSNNGMTGLDLYNISMEGAKGGIYVTTNGSQTNRFLEHLNVYGCRLAEFSINNRHKFIKFITPNTLNNIQVQGEVNFDQAYVTSFDVSEYYGSQGILTFNGLLRTENLTTLMNGRNSIGVKGILGFRKILIDGSNKGYNNVLINNDTTVIAPLSKNMILRADTHTVGIKLANNEFNYIGEFNIFINNNCTVNLLNNDGTTAKSYDLTPANCLIIKSVSTYGDKDVQLLVQKVDAEWAGSLSGN